MNPTFKITMENGGVIEGELYPDKAPQSVRNFINLCDHHFYDGLIFHRVIPGFMIQGGCPEGTGKRVQDYLAGAFARAQELGVRVVVFGSGGARRVPEGVTPAQAYRYLADYLALAGRMAAQHGLSIAVEPLRAAECNIIHHVAEAQYLAQRSGQRNVWALADLYHMMQGNENCAAIEERGVIHCHIADRARRFYPAAGDGSEGDYKAFFAALQKSGYDGRVSIEGRCEDFARDAEASFALLDALRRA